MTDTTTAPTPEELAARVVDELNASFRFQDSHIPTHGDEDWPPNPGVVSIIAAAIRQHSAPLEAQIAELTAKLQATDAAHYDATEGISATLQADALEAAEARATTAEAALAAAKLEWLPAALVSRAGWGERTGNDSHGTSRLLRQVAYLLETGAWVDDIERAALQTKEAGNVR